MIPINKKTIRKIIPYIVTIIFIGLVLYFSRNQLYQLKKITKIRGITVFWLSITFIVFQILQGYLLKLFTNIFYVKLNFLTSFGLICMQSFGNYLPLNAGVIYNAGYLKTQKNLPVTKFVSLMASSTMLMILAYGFIGTVILLFHFFSSGNISISMIVILLLFIIAGLIFLFVPITSFKKKNRIVKWIDSIQSGWKMIRKNKVILVKITIIHTITLILLSVRFLLIFRDLNIDIGITGIIILTIMTTVLRFNSIFPGNLGLRESVAGGVSKSFGFSFNIGLLAGIIDRIVAMFWIFLLGIIFSFVLLKKK